MSHHQVALQGITLGVFGRKETHLPCRTQEPTNASQLGVARNKFEEIQACIPATAPTAEQQNRAAHWKSSTQLNQVSSIDAAAHRTRLLQQCNGNGRIEWESTCRLLHMVGTNTATKHAFCNVPHPGKSIRRELAAASSISAGDGDMCGQQAPDGWHNPLDVSACLAPAIERHKQHI
jgi:hypothetical protein